jgi:hypothetical protein
LGGSTEKSAVRARPVHAGYALRSDLPVAFPIADHYTSGGVGLAADRLALSRQTQFNLRRKKKGIG